MSKPLQKIIEALLFLVVTMYLGAGLLNTSHPRCIEERRIEIPQETCKTSGAFLSKTQMVDKAHT
jgi:hypothetical protein